MPLYEYICEGCNHRFEALVTGSQAAHCPECEGSKLEQQFSAFAMGTVKGKGQFSKSAAPSGGCGSCGHPGGPGSCSQD